MALNKTIIQENGIETSYHRIGRMVITPNIDIIITVFSYVNEEARIKEKENSGYSPYKEEKIFFFNYDENINIISAYERLKNLEYFQDSTDILE